MQEIRSSNPPVVTEICDPNKSRARHHHSLKIGSKLKYIKISRTNEIRYVSWHKAFACKHILEASVCDNKQRWNNDKRRCECKTLIDKGRCDKGLIWNPTIM